LPGAALCPKANSSSASDARESTLGSLALDFFCRMPSGTLLAQSRISTTIEVHVPTPLRNCCAGASKLVLSAKTLRAVLEELERRYPKLNRSICDETGAVRRHINLFVNTQHMRDCHGLDTTLESNDVVTIMTAVSGG